MDLYADYLLEKEGKATLRYGKKAFVTYKIVPAEDKPICHVCILFVDPKYRNGKVARKIMEKLKEQYKDKCKAFTAAVFTKQNNSTSTLLILLRYGFEVVGVENDDILLYKEF